MHVHVCTSHSEKALCVCAHVCVFHIGSEEAWYICVCVHVCISHSEEALCVCVFHTGSEEV